MRAAVTIDGRRELEADLDAVDDGDAVVVACPPHPMYGGSRTDRRLRAACAGLTGIGVDCLRIDYGPWDGGPGERDDVVDALVWAAERYGRVGLFGYSFGATMAILAGASVGIDLVGVSVLAPSVRVAADADLDVVAALRALPCDAQVLYGERDQTVNWTPIVEAAEARGCDVVAIAGDHFFVGQDEAIAEAVATFFERCVT
ncbi:MAG: alpha/beta hydrolase [Halobacteriales archaeon]